jgi:hypothetical protein
MNEEVNVREYSIHITMFMHAPCFTIASNLLVLGLKKKQNAIIPV